MLTSQMLMNLQTAGAASVAAVVVVDVVVIVIAIVIPDLKGLYLILFELWRMLNDELKTCFYSDLFFFGGMECGHQDETKEEKKSQRGKRSNNWSRGLSEVAV